jgi:hypothetical protein
MHSTRSGLTKDYKIGICCFSAKHAALRRKSKECLARNEHANHYTTDESTIYHTPGEPANHYTTYEITIYHTVDCGFIGGVMVSVLASSVVDRGFIGGVMVSDEPTIYHT